MHLKSSNHKIDSQKKLDIIQKSFTCFHVYEAWIGAVARVDRFKLPPDKWITQSLNRVNLFDGSQSQN